MYIMLQSKILKIAVITNLATSAAIDAKINEVKDKKINEVKDKIPIITN